MKKSHFGNCYDCWIYMVRKDGYMDVDWYTSWGVRPSRWRSIRSAMRFMRKHFPQDSYIISSFYRGIPKVKKGF